MTRRLVFAFLLACTAPGIAHAAEPTQAQKDQWAKEGEDRLHHDWPWLAKYRDANAALPGRGKEPRVVFMGDSITENWASKEPGFFTVGRIGRGISGQTTPQMVARFRQDVLDLHPAVVQIMAGTNDIAGNTGPMTPEQTEANIRTMTELAQAHGIRVILASIPPAAQFPWRQSVPDVANTIIAINGWIKAYAAKTGSTYVDYWSALQDGKGGFRAAWTIDGVHPNVDGYDVMIPLAQKAIGTALAKPAPKPLAITTLP
jgi:lysophospholipase L1-like esterase